MQEYSTFFLGLFIAFCIAISFLGFIFLIFINCSKKIESETNNDNDIETQLHTSQQSL